VPSGDRHLARALLRALDHAGHEGIVASRFRSFDRSGDPARQARLERLGERIAQRLIARWRDDRPPDAWLTYHLYHKAPDVIGPAVARALRIPYVVAEASISPRQHDGPWARGHALAVDAVRTANAIICLNPRDMPQVRRARGIDASVTLLPPFIDVAAFTAHVGVAGRAHRSDLPPRMITVAMMRDGAKLASYRALAAGLAGLRDLDWSLRIVGDGPARGDVEHAFAGMADRVSFLGARDALAIAALLRDSDLFVWPAIDEAIGLVFVEAQACGLPVVGGDSAGVAAVVDAGRTGLLTPEGDIGAFAAATRSLLTDAPLRDRFGAAAPGYVRARHDLPAAAAALDAVLRDAVARRRATALAPNA
jgi:glycosyltransferase involved in cell wall biosynthesis